MNNKVDYYLILVLTAPLNSNIKITIVRIQMPGRGMRQQKVILFVVYMA